MPSHDRAYTGRRRWHGQVVLALLGCAALIPVRLVGQCTLASAPVSFEPNPPGVPRGATLLSSGFSNHLALYRGGARSTRRLMMQESFGYSVLDLANPLKPTALLYHDLRIPVDGPNVVTARGDGQSYVQTIAVSGDGARAAFSLNGAGVPPWNTVVGSASRSAVGFTIWGDFFPNKAAGTVIQQAGSRYIAYDIHFSLNATAIDVTTLPTSLDPNGSNMQGETTSWPAGSSLSLAGNYLLYMAGGDIQVIDASNPGPPGNITGAYPRTTVTSADFGGRAPLDYAAAVDPIDPNKLWILVELAATPGQAAPSYGLVSLRKGFPASAQSAGPLFQVPSNPGDFFSNVGSASALIPSNGSLFVLMWAKRLSAAGTTEFRLYSTTASGWASLTPASFPVSGPGFGLTSTMSGFGDGATVYAFVPTTVSAFVIPMTCSAPDAPAFAGLGNLLVNDVRPVQSCETASTLADCTVFLGDRISGTIAVVPSPSPPLTAFNLDLDFHAGAPSEDGGPPPAFPRIRTPDNAALGLPPGAPPPTSFTIVGPCDPNVAGASVGSGVNCWASVMGNANWAGGAPDFTGAETSATPCRTLTFAFEAANAFGSAGAELSSLCWQVPAVRATAQILTGDPVDASASDGHPAASGYSWYFGGNSSAPAGERLALDAACSGPACPHVFPGKGTFNFWVKVPYANGYVSPDCAGAPAACTPPSNALKVTVADFVPRFLVNDSAADRINVVTSQPPITITNLSSKAAAVTGSYFYSLCQIPAGQTTCAAGPPGQAGAYTAFALQDRSSNTGPSTSASIPAPAVAGNWILRIRVTYGTNGIEDWRPDIPGALDPFSFRITASDLAPEIHVFVNGANPCGFLGCVVNAFTAFVGDRLAAYSYLNATAQDSAVPVWDFPGASPPSGTGQGATFSYAAPGIYTVTLHRGGILVTATGRVNALAPPPQPTPPPTLFVLDPRIFPYGRRAQGSPP